MAYLKVYDTPGGGWLLDVQTDLLDGLNVRTVVPLMVLGDAPVPAKRLNPIVEVDGTRTSMVTQYIASVPSSILGHPVADLSDRRDEITSALDMLLHGF